MSPHSKQDDSAPVTGGAAEGEGKTPETWLMGTEAFEARMPHHDGIKALWETKWKFPCMKSLYPFHDGAYEDFEPIFKHLIQNNINDPTSAAYTEAFVPTAERLTAEGDAALRAGEAARASALFLRACAVYRIARFPYVAAMLPGPSTATAATRKTADKEDVDVDDDDGNDDGYASSALSVMSDPAKWRAWDAQKRVYLRAGATWPCPVEEVGVVHRYGRPREGGVIPVYVRVPEREGSSFGGASSGGAGGGITGKVKAKAKGKGKIVAAPTVVLMTGLDGYRPDNTVRCEEFLKRGWASVVVEIPGTADCPADCADPTAPDRLWTSLLDWMAEDGRFDMRRVLVWGLSSGGYYAMRAAHTHAGRLLGCVAQGAGCHYFFDRAWLDKVDGHEYPFELNRFMALKHGFHSVQEYKAKAQKKFSLLENGILQMPSTRLLLVNGMKDGLMPIEDSLLPFQYGSAKEGRFIRDALHMGYPTANDSVYPWMEQVMASVKN